MHSSATAALAALAFFITSTTAHSWVEEMDVIDPKTGTFTGNPGYSRNNTKRTVPGFSDPLMVHILPSAGQPAIEQRDTIPALDTTGVYPNDTMCKHTQQSQYQSDGSPRLQAAPGDLVALRYQENGHVTIPLNQPGKPSNRGTVYIYGTTQPKFPELFLDVFGQWTADGTGGDKRGRLLATQPFDDGYCYQVNGGNISTHRQAQYPHTPNELMGANLWCQVDIALPTDIATGKPYSLYWTWDWPTEPNVDPNLPKGKAELYTTCMDVDIVTKPGSRRRVKARQAPQPSQPASGHLNSAAIPAYVSSLIASPVPAAAAAASGAVQSSPSPASPASAVTPAAGVSVVAGSNSMTNAGVSSYIMDAVSAAIAADAPKVPLTITVDIVDASAGAAATQPAATAEPAPVASPAYVATSASSAPSQAAASAPTPSASPAAAAAAAPAAASSPSTASPSSPAQAPAMATPSLPPKSLAINPPVLAAQTSTSTSISSPGFSGTASPVVASPAVEATSTSASVSLPGFSGTASPVAVSPAVATSTAAPASANSNSTSPVMAGASQNGTVAAKGQCKATTCKSKRQSKILGPKGGSRRLFRV